MKNLNLLHDAMTTPDKETANALIKQFILSNDLHTKSKFNLYDFTAKKYDFNPIVMGVNYRNGFAYATDLHMAIKIKQEYTPELENKTIDKKGANLTGTFPDVDAVIPDDKNLTYIPFDFARVSDIEKLFNIDRKTNKDLQIGVIKIGNVYLSVTLLSKIAKFALHLGITTVGVQEATRCIKITNGESAAILMPVMFNEEAENQKLYTL